MAHELGRYGLRVERQLPVPIIYQGVALQEGFRIDLFVERSLIIEVKSVEKLAAVHGKQLLTYLRLAKQPVGLLMNFNAATFREGNKTRGQPPHQLRVFASSREPALSPP